MTQRRCLSHSRRITSIISSLLTKIKSVETQEGHSLARIVAKEEYLTSCGIPAKSFRMIDVNSLKADPFYSHKTSGGTRMRLFVELVSDCVWETTEVPVYVLNGLVDHLTLHKGQRWFRSRTVAKRLKISRSALNRALESGQKADQWDLKTGPLYSVVTIEKHLLFKSDLKKPDHRTEKPGPRYRSSLTIERLGKYFSLEGRRKGRAKPKAEPWPEMTEETRIMIAELKKNLEVGK